MNDLPPIDQNRQSIGLVRAGKPLQVVSEDCPAVSWPFVHPTKLRPPLTWTFHLYFTVPVTEPPPTLECHQNSEFLNGLNGSYLVSFFRTSFRDSFVVKPSLVSRVIA